MGGPLTAHTSRKNLTFAFKLRCICLRYQMRTAFILIGTLLIAAGTGHFAVAVAPGQRIALAMTDLDGNSLSTADGHVTTLVLASRADADKARLVGDRSPARCLGEAKYRMITVIQFPKSTSRTMRYVLSAMVRSRLDSEARHLKPRYAARKLARDPRADVHVVVDFDGEIASHLNVKEPAAFRVFVFASDGTLLRQWSDVPDAEVLDKALP